MNSSARKLTKNGLESRRLSLREKFARPDYIIEQMAQYLKDGDVASITDLISAYVSNSSKYENQEKFAKAIGTTRQTLHRMLAHSDSVSIRHFFRAIERIHGDIEVQKS